MFSGFKWSQFLVKMLSLVPVIVAGIEQIHGDAKTGVEKKQLAMEALGLAQGVAGATVSDELKPTVDAATGLASAVIDGTVSVMNAAKGQGTPAIVASSPAAAAASTSA